MCEIVKVYELSSTKTRQNDGFSIIYPIHSENIEYLMDYEFVIEMKEK